MFPCALLCCRVICSCFSIWKYPFSQDSSFIAFSLPNMKAWHLVSTCRVLCTRDFVSTFRCSCDNHILVGTSLIVTETKFLQWVTGGGWDVNTHVNLLPLHFQDLWFPARSHYARSRPWRGHEENTRQARPSRTPSMTRSWGKTLTDKAVEDIRDPPGWPRPLPHPVSSPRFCCCSCLPWCGFLCCLPRALLLLFHWVKTNLKR